MKRIAYLGPEGTFTEDALKAALGEEGQFERLRTATVHEAILAVQDGAADRALVPFENSIEGSVRATLDALALEAKGVTIVGEYDHVVSPSLICRRPLEPDEIEAVLSHPQALAQCARFLREQLPAAEARAVESTAEAVRLIGSSDRPWAALAAASAAPLYGCVVVREDVADEADNVTRFVWLAPAGTRPVRGGTLEDEPGLRRAG